MLSRSRRVVACNDMKNIQELHRRTSPAPQPQALGWDGAKLWMGSRETKRLYSIDPSTWTVDCEIPASGTPWGLTVVQDELRVVCGETTDDNRIIRRCLQGKGFDGSFGLRCPDDTGSQLSFDGQRLHLSQWYAKKLLTLDAAGKVERMILIPHEICGQVYVDGCFYLVTTDREETTDYWLTRVNLGSTQPRIDDLVRIPFAARALAFDGRNFWTNHREKNEIVAFVRPD
jgi:hypothetical protein